MQSTPKVFSAGNQLQFRQWSSREKDDFLPPAIDEAVKLNIIPRQGSISIIVLATPVAFLWSSREREATRSRKRAPSEQDARKTAQDLSKTHLSLLLRGSVLVFDRSPSLISLISKISFRSLFDRVQPRLIPSSLPNLFRNELKNISRKDGQISLSITCDDEKSHSTSYSTPTIINGDIDNTPLNNGTVVNRILKLFRQNGIAAQVQTKGA